MSRVDPAVMPVLEDLSRGMRELGVRFAIIGALVPELLLDERPSKATNDADAAVIVDSLAGFNRLKEQLGGYGFRPARRPHQMTHTSGGRLDILPCGDTVAPDGRLELQPGFVLNLAGFHHVIPNAVTATINGITLPLAPLPLYVLLKLVAFGDRRAGKDLDGVLYTLEHYLDADDGRRYELEHEGRGVLYEHTAAFAVGMDAKRFVDEHVREALITVLTQLEDPYAEGVRLLLVERGFTFPGDDQRKDVLQAFRWFRAGLGL